MVRQADVTVRLYPRAMAGRSTETDRWARTFSSGLRAGPRQTAREPARGPVSRRRRVQPARRAAPPLGRWEAETCPTKRAGGPTCTTA